MDEQLDGPRPDVTALLARAGAGDRAALDEALPLVYDELRRLAHRALRREGAGHTLGTAALVHEAYLRLVDQRPGAWHDRAHFLAVAATAMRRVLVDYARRRGAAKRGAAAHPVTLDALAEGAALDLAGGDDAASRLADLDVALVRLARLDARQARVVECRFFGGLTEEETAAALGIGLRTAKRDWAKARSWLYQELHPGAVA
jgi:RNA polymerase sigma factor (TIGR02999 family)